MVALAMIVDDELGDRATKMFLAQWNHAIKTDCLDRVVPLGECHLRRTVAEFVPHYHGERNHQGIGNELIVRASEPGTNGRVRRRQRLGGMLNFYYRAA